MQCTSQKTFTRRDGAKPVLEPPLPKAATVVARPMLVLFASSHRNRLLHAFLTAQTPLE